MQREVTVKKVYKPFTVCADGPDEATGEAEAWMRENKVPVDHYEFEIVPVADEAVLSCYDNGYDR